MSIRPATREQADNWHGIHRPDIGQPSADLSETGLKGFDNMTHGDRFSFGVKAANLHSSIVREGEFPMGVAVDFPYDEAAGATRPGQYRLCSFRHNEQYKADFGSRGHLFIDHMMWTGGAGGGALIPVRAHGEWMGHVSSPCTEN